MQLDKSLKKIQMKDETSLLPLEVSKLKGESLTLPREMRKGVLSAITGAVGLKLYRFWLEENRLQFVRIYQNLLFAAGKETYPAS